MDLTVCFGEPLVVTHSQERWQTISWYLAALVNDSSSSTCINQDCTCSRERFVQFPSAVSHDVHLFLFDGSVLEITETCLLSTTRALLYLCASDHVLHSIQQTVDQQWEAMSLAGKANGFTALSLVKRLTATQTEFEQLTRAVVYDDDALNAVRNESHMTIQEKLEFIQFYYEDCAVLLPVDKWWPAARVTAQVYQELQSRISYFSRFQRATFWVVGEFIAMVALGYQTAAPICLHSTHNISDDALLPIFTDMAKQGFYFGQRSPTTIIAVREEEVLTFLLTNAPTVASLVHSLPIDAIQAVWCPVIGVMASPKCLLAWLSRVCRGPANDVLLRLQEIGFDCGKLSLAAVDRDSAFARRSVRCKNRSDHEIRREFRLLMDAQPMPPTSLSFCKYANLEGLIPWVSLDAKQYANHFYCYHVHFPWATTVSSPGVYPIYPSGHALYFEIGPVRIRGGQLLEFVPTAEMRSVLTRVVSYLPAIQRGESIELSTQFRMAGGVNAPCGTSFLILRPYALQRLFDKPVTVLWECVHCTLV